MGWKARLVPQAWINDYAVDVDPEGDTDWSITDVEADGALDEARRGGDWDYIRSDTKAPSWVREWARPLLR